MRDDSMSLVFLTCRTSDVILGHIPFRMMFTDLHGVTWSFLLVRCALGRWLICHFYDDTSVETLGIHPVKPARLGIPMSPWLPLWDAFWTLGPDSVLDWWLGLYAWWEMISCHLFFWLVTHSMSYWGIFSFRMRFMDLHGGHMFDDKWFLVARSSTYHTFDAIMGHISVLDEIYRSWWSCMLILICETYAETMIYLLSLRWFLREAFQELPS